jgi:large subunit ribosomal protein L3
MKGILGKKLGMTSVYNEQGNQVAVTALDVGGNVVVGKRTMARDGYTALIVGFGSQKVHRLNQPEAGFLKKQGLISKADLESTEATTVRQLCEFRMSETDLSTFTVGQVIKPSALFKVGEKIDISGDSKGRGFTGVMKRHNFSGAKATHGVHEYFRHGGSIGTSTYPARVRKNKKMAGQYGDTRVTVQNLSVVGVMDDEGVLLVRGAIPGATGGVLEVKQGVKVRRD